MNTQNVILSIISIALIILMLMVARGHVGNISVSMPAPEVNVEVKPAEVVPEFHCPSIVTVSPQPYESRYRDKTVAISEMIERYTEKHYPQQWEKADPVITYLGEGVWECQVDYKVGLAVRYYFDEETGKIQ